jgi:hypothetical protein
MYHKQFDLNIFSLTIYKNYKYQLENNIKYLLYWNQM